MKIPCKPLSTILSQYCNEHIDLMSIDTEGIDLKVLQSNDWSKFRPDVIVVENENFDFENMNNDPIYSFITQQRYSLYAKTNLSLIFKTNER